MSKNIYNSDIEITKILKEKSTNIIEEYNKNPNLCNQCKKNLIFNKRNNKYCSKSCSAKTNNKGVRRHGKEPDNCRYCKSKLLSTRSKFCNNLCFSKQKNIIYEQKIDKEEDFGNIKSYRRAKLYLIKKRGHKCEICKNDYWMGAPIPLVFDHIDGRSNNNKLRNIRLVCGNCDMQLPTYKSKNKNSDRKERYLKQRKQ